MPETGRTLSSSVRWPSRTEVRPTRSSIWKNPPIWGRRRSAETSSIRSPAWANTTPRLARVEVLPSPTPGLVTIRLRSCRSCRANCSEVRSDRYDSAAGEVGSLTETTTGPCRRQVVTTGVRASTGVPLALSVASLEPSRSSRLSRRKAAARPRASPAARPSRASWTGLGELGETGACAGVTSTTSLGLTAPLTCIWASCSFSTACWLSSAEATGEVVSDLKGLSSLPSAEICERSWASAPARLRSATAWRYCTNEVA